MQNNITMADTYFSTNFLGKDIWEAINPTDKEMLITTAESDINAYLKWDAAEDTCIKSEAPYTSYQMAVFEWALYLYENKESIKKNIKDMNIGVTTISVDGIGQETKGGTSKRYKDTYAEMIEHSPAYRYLLMIYKDIRIIR